MNKEHLKGALDQIVGKTKEIAGQVTGDPVLQTEGKVERAKGSLHNVLGDVKDAGREALNRIKS